MFTNLIDMFSKLFIAEKCNGIISVGTNPAVEITRAGRISKNFAKEFEPCADTVRDWIAQADRDDDRLSDGLGSFRFA